MNIIIRVLPRSPQRPLSAKRTYYDLIYWRKKARQVWRGIDVLRLDLSFARATRSTRKIIILFWRIMANGDRCTFITFRPRAIDVVDSRIARDYSTLMICDDRLSHYRGFEISFSGSRRYGDSTHSPIRHSCQRWNARIASNVSQWIADDGNKRKWNGSQFEMIVKINHFKS